MDNATKDREDSILGFESVFKLEVLIPERMSKEIQANAGRATLE
jgi:hypothetical protein